jgi:hypothetical protein
MRRTRNWPAVGQSRRPTGVGNCDPERCPSALSSPSHDCRQGRLSRDLGLLPPAQAALVDRVCADDATWSAEHPERRWRLRQYVPGEVAPLGNPDASCVLVVPIAPGLRIRLPIQCSRPLSDVEVEDLIRALRREAPVFAAVEGWPKGPATS